MNRTLVIRCSAAALFRGGAVAPRSVGRAHTERQAAAGFADQARQDRSVRD